MMMANTQPQRHYEIGMVGLGVMGRNFLQNMADHSCSVAGYGDELLHFGDIWPHDDVKSVSLRVIVSSATRW